MFCIRKHIIFFIIAHYPHRFKPPVFSARSQISCARVNLQIKDKHHMTSVHWTHIRVEVCVIVKCVTGNKRDEL